MPGPWDSAAKRLLREMPQHIVSWLLADAQFERALPTELKSRNIFADGLYAVTEYGQPAFCLQKGEPRLMWCRRW